MILKYAGGKGRVAQDILAFMPTGVTEWRDIFAGNAPFLWHLPETLSRWINDLDPDVYRYYMALKKSQTFVDRFMALRAKCLTAEDTLRQVDPAKRRLVRDDDSVAFAFLKRVAHRQIVTRNRSNICSLQYKYLRDGLNPVTRERALEARRILQRVKITHGDYTVPMLAPTDGRCLIYCDPPYKIKHNSSPIYGYELTTQQHVDLSARLEMLNPDTHPFILSMSDSEICFDIYLRSTGFHSYVRDVHYGMRDDDGQVAELVITNFLIE